MGSLGYVDSLVGLVQWGAYAQSESRKQSIPFTIETTAPLPGKPIRRQWDFIDSKATAIKLICPRRVGKTVGLVKRTCKKSWEHAGRRTLYINHTLGNAKRQFFDPPGEAAHLGLLGTLDHHGIGYTADRTNVFAELENGSFVQGVGCDNLGEVRKKLGFYWHEIIIDEIQEYAEELLDLLVRRALGPTLIQTRGTLVLSGTQPEVHAGFWWEIINDKSYEEFSWQMLDNPMITREGIIEEMAKVGFTVDFDNPSNNHPIVQREVFCLPAIDTNALMYEYTEGPDANDYPAGGIPELGAKTWRYAMGVDIGGAADENDSDAIVVWGWRMDDATRKIYERHAWKGHGDSDEFCSRVVNTFLQWQPMQSLCIDTAGAGATKMIAAMRPRFGNLETTPKPSSVDVSRRLMQDELRSHRMRLAPNGLIANAAKICRKTAHEDDVLAAARYAFHGAVNWLAKEPTKKEETYNEYLERNIRERQRRRQAGARGMWAYNR